MRKLLVLVMCLAILGPVAGRADDDACAALRPRNTRPVTGVTDAAGDVRVYAIQYKQEIAYVERYATFRQKMFCLVHDFVMPTADADGDGKADRPTIVVFNEDNGLATIATGSRGAPARAIAQYGVKDPQNIPGALSAFGSLAPGYAPAISTYAQKFPETSAQRLILAAATDTFARGFMQVFSDMARAFGLYVVSSNNQAEFKVTSMDDDGTAVNALMDPDLAHAYAVGALNSVYEAVDTPGTVGVGRAGVDVFNQAWLWAPVNGVTDYARQRFEPFNGKPLTREDPRANVIANNKKTPLTPIELSVLDLSDDRDLSPANTGPFHLLVQDDPARAIKIGFGISLPAFMWGTDFGVAFDGDPCASPATWMRCLDARGMNLFLQPEANPGRWADYIDTSWKPAAYQSLSWLDSAWRAVADPTVANIRYAVTPHMVGNLVDLTFDGQSLIAERCIARGSGSNTCDGNVATNFVGAREFVRCVEGRTERCDDPLLEPYAGEHREFIAAAPWVAGDCPMCLGPVADRERLAAISRQLEAGTGSAIENDYVETALFADLDFD